MNLQILLLTKLFPSAFIIRCSALESKGHSKIHNVQSIDAVCTCCLLPVGLVLLPVGDVNTEYRVEKLMAMGDVLLRESGVRRRLPWLFRQQRRASRVRLALYRGLALGHGAQFCIISDLVPCHYQLITLRTKIPTWRRPASSSPSFTAPCSTLSGTCVRLSTKTKRGRPYSPALTDAPTASPLGTASPTKYRSRFAAGAPPRAPNPAVRTRM